MYVETAKGWVQGMMFEGGMVGKRGSGEEGFSYNSSERALGIKESWRKYCPYKLPTTYLLARDSGI